MRHSTETDRRTTRSEQPIAILQLLFTAGAAAPFDRSLAPVQRIVVGKGGLLIGRELQAEDGFSLPHDRRVSTRHASLQHNGNSIVLRDADSKNGTYLNGQSVQEAILADRAVIRTGGTLFLFRLQAARLPRSRSAQERDPTREFLVGDSQEMVRLRHELLCAAQREAPVLLLGQSGTGKELASLTLHRLSTSREGPLIRVNCATITPALAESMLFGHVEGAFTGARSSQPGYFRKAHGGTLLLDEIGDLPSEIQPKLLRALEEGQIWPVGARGPEPCVVRIIAATNRELPAEVKENRFRADLLQRLSVIRINMPTLAERREDILPLFLSFLGARPAMTATLAESLLLHPWLGNVRELRNLAEHVKTFTPELSAELDEELVQRKLTEAMPPVDLSPSASSAPAKPKVRSSAYTDVELIRLARESRGIVSQLAERLGLSRRQVGRLFTGRGIDPHDFRKKPSSDDKPDE